MPPASSNDNQGLKIAIAIFATLSVFLGVATYFGFSEASKNAEKMDQANKDAGAAKQAANELQNQFNTLKELGGYAKTDDSVVKDQIPKDIKAVSDAVSAIAGKAANAVAGGGAGPQAGNIQQALEEFRTSSESFANEPNKTLLASLTRLQQILGYQSDLMTAQAADLEGVRKELEASNQVAKQKIDVEVSAKETSDADRLSEMQKHEEDRKSLIGRNDDLQQRNQQLANEVNTLKTTLAQTQEDLQKKIDNLLAINRTQRESLEATDVHLESANGLITYVDYNRGEVRTTLSRGAGAREQMIFSVFDKEAAGIPSDKPKAKIELIRVDDRGSIGRIIESLNTLDPIRMGDQLYSPGYGARPRKFALIGWIDIDRDGQDDRNDLKRMIESAGGEVSYDLPPPGVGVEYGELTPETSWYVLGDEEGKRTFHPGSKLESGATAEQEAAYLKKRTLMVSEARASGVRPIAIDRLLAMLNYKYGAAVPGRVEAYDRKAFQDRLSTPAGTRTPQTPPASDTPEGGPQP